MQRSNARFVERLPLVLNRPVYAYILTLSFCGLALLLRFAAEPLLPDGYPFVTFFPAVILSSFLFGVRPGIFAAILCAAASWYFFIAPRNSFVLNPGVAAAMIFYTGVVVVDIVLIHFMQRANFHLAIERERSAALAENRERHVDHDVARRALDDASERLALIGRISRALYDPSGAGQGVRAFLTTLTADVIEASGRTDIAISVNAPEEVQLEPGITVPLALVVAEAVSNAIEHGLPHRGGTIAVVLDHHAGELCLRVSDDGDGVSPDFAVEHSKSLGLRIANTLAAQIGGRFTLAPGAHGGAVAQLILPPRAAC